MRGDGLAAKRNSRKGSGAVIGLTIFVLLLIALAGGYLAVAHYFESHFYPGTSVNGKDASLSTAENVEEGIAAGCNAYILAVHDRDERVAYINASQIDYHYEADGSVAALLENQDTLLWPKYVFEEREYTVPVPAGYDEEKLIETIGKMECFKKENITEPKDAYVKDTGAGLEIVPEVIGNKPLKEQIILDIEAAIEEKKGSLTLTDADYIQPAVRSDDPDLVKKVELSDQYKAMTVTYEVAGTTWILEGSTMITWITIEDDLSVTVNEKLVAAYVQQLASSYNTYAKERQFKTTKGDTITIGGGDYGWIIDKDAEAKQLTEDVKAGKSIKREPCYLQRAFENGSDDVGDTYVELDYTNQHMYYYKKGQLVVDADIVSGNINVGNGSPDGVFKIIDRKTNTTLKGEDYASDVDYFMPFAYNVGLHDASWRSNFGGSIYKGGGSHGCVNLPFKAAETLFNNVEIGTPVIAYYREPVKLRSNNAKVSNAYSYQR